MKCSSKYCDNEATVFQLVTGLPTTRGRCQGCYERAVLGSVRLGKRNINPREEYDWEEDATRPDERRYLGDVDHD